MTFNSSDFVTFNVAGRPFTTMRSTVLREPASRLALMLRSVIPAVQDSSGAFFIDRDPKHFALVLNYLRDGWCTLPKDEADKKELLQEVRYFQLASMEAWMRTQEALAHDKASLDPGHSSSYGRSSPTSVLHHQHSPTHSPIHSPNHSAGGAPPAPHSPMHQQHQLYQLSPRPSSAAGLASEVLHSQMESNFARSSLASPVSPMQHVPLQQPPASYTSYSAAAAGVMARLTSQRSSAFEGMLHSMPSGGMQLPPAEQTVATAGHSIGSKLIPAPLADDGFKWTSKYLKTNEKLREVVNTLLELAYLPPHRSLQGGKVSISISSECEHDRIASMLGTSSTEYLRSRYQVVRVKGALGWSFEFTVRPSSELDLFEKYHLAEFMQDNWFVLSAVLKDQYGIVVEEDTSARPTCTACRRTNMAITMQKFY